MRSRRKSRASATEARVSNDRLLTAMADRGYREIISYSFVDPVLQQQLFPDIPSLKFANPISADLSDMRVSLWAGSGSRLPRESAATANAGAVVRDRQKFQSAERSGKTSELREIETLAGIATGARWPEQWGSAREAAGFLRCERPMCTDVLRSPAMRRAVRFEPDELAVLAPRTRRANLSRRNADRLAGRDASADGEGAEFADDAHFYLN